MSVKKIEVEEKELDHLKAYRRAVIMAKCFEKKDAFESFVKAINDTNFQKKAQEPGPGSDWAQACNKAQLTAQQSKWLWNYLKEYDKSLAWNQSSAMNGW